MVDLSQKISKSAPDLRHSERSEGSFLLPSQAPDPEQLRQILSSPDGRALIRLLQADGGAGLRRAAAALQAGNAEEAKAALSPLLAGTDAEALTRSLEGKL